MSERRPFTITCLHRENGYWQAHVTEDGVTVRVDRRDGSWLIRRPGGAIADVLPHVAAALQARVAPTDNAERRERERLAEEARKAAQASQAVAHG